MKWRIVLAGAMMVAGASAADYPDNMVPYHVHADVVATLSNLVERVSAIEARHARIAERRAAAAAKREAAVPVKKRINELNELLKKRYLEKKQ